MCSFAAPADVPGVQLLRGFIAKISINLVHGKRKFHGTLDELQSFHSSIRSFSTRRLGEKLKTVFFWMEYFCVIRRRAKGCNINS